MHDHDQPRASLDDRFAAAFSRAVTRRTALRRSMELAAATAAVTSVRLTFPRRAEAGGLCKTRTDRYGIYCARTPSCGKTKCCRSWAAKGAKDLCCNGAEHRCTAWPKTTSPGGSGYCWCSKTGCVNGKKGYYSCCDCWKFGNREGTCMKGRGACVCKGRKRTGGTC